VLLYIFRCGSLSFPAADYIRRPSAGSIVRRRRPCFRLIIICTAALLLNGEEDKERICKKKIKKESENLVSKEGEGRGGERATGSRDGQARRKERKEK